MAAKLSWDGTSLLYQFLLCAEMFDVPTAASGVTGNGSAGMNSISKNATINVPFSLAEQLWHPTSQKQRGQDPRSLFRLVCAERARDGLHSKNEERVCGWEEHHSTGRF